MSKDYEVACVFGYYLDEDSVYKTEKEYSTSLEDLVATDEDFQLPEGCILVSFNGGYDCSDRNYAVGVTIEYVAEYLLASLEAKSRLDQPFKDRMFNIVPDPTPLISWSHKFGLKFTTENPVLVIEVDAS